MKTTKQILLGSFLCMALVLSSGAALERFGRISQASVFKTPEGWLGLQVECSGTPSFAPLRVMLDVDGLSRGEPQSGADFMIEKGRFYRYPMGASDWSWDELAPPYILQDDRTVTFILRDVPFASRVKWHVELVRPDWSVMGRFPDRGELEFDYATLPAKKPAPRVMVGGISDLLAQMPRTLSFRLDAEIKDQLWKSESGIQGLSWKPVGIASNIPFKIFLVDVVSGKSETLTLGEASISSNNWLRWTGRALDVDWVLIGESAPDGSLRLMGQLSADNERCVRWGLGCSMDLTGWTWYDDMSSSRVISAEAGLFENTDQVPWGERGGQSIYPFGVISSDMNLLMVETDTEEPRSLQIVADAKEHFFGVWYDLALTPATSNFPSRAAFQCIFRSEQSVSPSFRHALASFYRRYPSFSEGQKAAHDLATGMQTGLKPNLDSVLISEPWSYGQILPAPFAKDERDFAGLTALRAACSRLGDREMAASALLGSARKADGSRQIVFTGNPTLAGTVVNVDPELPVTPELPLNRAMSEWSHLRGGLRDARYAGIRLNNWNLLSSMDYNPQAVSVADYPCVFERGVHRPALAAAFAAQDFLVPLSRVVHQNNKIIVLDDPLKSLPFVMPLADAFTKTVETSRDGRYMRPDTRDMNHLRSLSGRKPVLLVMKDPSTNLMTGAAAQYLRDSLYWGFVPGFEAGSSYEAFSRLSKQDQNLFKTYQPLSIRLAKAGWHPENLAQAEPVGMAVESFGDESKGLRHLTVRNLADDNQRMVLAIPVSKSCLVVNPLNAAVEWLSPAKGEAKVIQVLRPEEVMVLDWVDESAIAEEIAFLKNWNAGWGESTACVKNVESLLAEKNFSAKCRMSWTTPAVKGQPNVFRLEISNLGSTALSVSGLKLITSQQFMPFEDQAGELAPGSNAVFQGWFAAEDVSSDPWMEVQWGLKRGASELFCSRLVRPEFVAPVEVTSPETRIMGENEVASIQLRVRNNSSKEASVLIKYEGDFKGGRLEETIASESTKILSVPVKPGKTREGQMFVRVYSSGNQVFQSWYEVSFSGD
jgi:hypothetical protein